MIINFSHWVIQYMQQFQWNLILQTDMKVSRPWFGSHIDSIYQSDFVENLALPSSSKIVNNLSKISYLSNLFFFFFFFFTVKVTHANKDTAMASCGEFTVLYWPKKAFKVQTLSTIFHKFTNLTCCFQILVWIVHICRNCSHKNLSNSFALTGVFLN